MPIASYCIFVSCAKVQGLCGESIHAVGRSFTSHDSFNHQMLRMRLRRHPRCRGTIHGPRPISVAEMKNQKVKNENPCLDTFGCGLGDFMEVAVENEPWNTLPVHLLEYGWKNYALVGP